MAERIILKTYIRLKSDAIFGTGFVAPGSEDISVCKDKEGYPYIKGTTLKGHLRESLSNVLDWTGSTEESLKQIMGESGWVGEASNRRLQLTSFYLAEEDRKKRAEECYIQRAFTSLENGVAKKGSLRMAECIKKNQVFEGELECNEEDRELIEISLSTIKWMGTLRNRGFGEVEITTEKISRESKKQKIANATCIHYRLLAQAPVIITNYAKSQDISNQTYGYITGSSVRGAVIGKLASEDPEWFEMYKVDLLSRTRFLNALPLPEILEENQVVVNQIVENRGAKTQIEKKHNKNRNELISGISHKNITVLPTIKGFYEMKDGSKFTSVLYDGELDLGLKRASLGEFCYIQDKKIKYWRAKSEGTLRIHKNQSTIDNENRLFQTVYLNRGQVFEGYILLDVPELSEKITSKMQENDILWIGADRYEGFGKCKVELLEATEEPAWRTVYGYQSQEELSRTLYLLAVSPCSMLNEFGQSSSFDEEELAKMLGVKNVTIELCSTSVSEYGGFNRTWGCQLPLEQMYDSGSIFKLECSEIPPLERILQIQREGMGVRLSEGYGQILFLREDIFKKISEKEELIQNVELFQKNESITNNAKIRRARIHWIMSQNIKEWKGSLSKSQLGNLQTILERCYQKNNKEELDTFFEKINNDNYQRKSRYEKICQLITNVLNQPFGKTIEEEYDNDELDQMERYLLLAELFNYSRKLEDVDSNEKGKK